MSQSLSEQAHTATIESVKKDAPSQFRVGGTFDGNKVTGGLSIDRKWSNGWGLTGYLRAYWYDQPIVPTDKYGVVVGGELTKTFTHP